MLVISLNDNRRTVYTNKLWNKGFYIFHRLWTDSILGYNFRLHTKLNKHPDEYVLAVSVKDELGKSANKAIYVDNGVHENKIYRNY